jgi:hypothetical protein
MLEHGAALVAPPVGAGDAEQLERGDLRRGFDVGPLAQVHEAVVPVDRDSLSLVQAFDQLQFVGLIGE